MNQIEGTMYGLQQKKDAYARKDREHQKMRKEKEAKLKIASDTLEKNMRGKEEFQPRIDTARYIFLFVTDLLVFYFELSCNFASCLM